MLARILEQRHATAGVDVETVPTLLSSIRPCHPACHSLDRLTNRPRSPQVPLPDSCPLERYEARRTTSHLFVACMRLITLSLGHPAGLRAPTVRSLAGRRWLHLTRACNHSALAVLSALVEVFLEFSIAITAADTAHSLPGCVASCTSLSFPTIPPAASFLRLAALERFCRPAALRASTLIAIPCGGCQRRHSPCSLRAPDAGTCHRPNVTSQVSRFVLALRSAPRLPPPVHVTSRPVPHVGGTGVHHSDGGAL